MNMIPLCLKKRNNNGGHDEVLLHVTVWLNPQHITVLVACVIVWLLVLFMSLSPCKEDLGLHLIEGPPQRSHLIPAWWDNYKCLFCWVKKSAFKFGLNSGWNPGNWFKCSLSSRSIYFQIKLILNKVRI